jgi:hypothetical protein
VLIGACGRDFAILDLVPLRTTTFGLVRRAAAGAVLSGTTRLVLLLNSPLRILAIMGRHSSISQMVRSGTTYMFRAKKMSKLEHVALLPGLLLLVRLQVIGALCSNIRTASLHTVTEIVQIIENIMV